MILARSTVLTGNQSSAVVSVSVPPSPNGSRTPRSSKFSASHIPHATSKASQSSSLASPTAAKTQLAAPSKSRSTNRAAALPPSFWAKPSALSFPPNSVSPARIATQTSSVSRSSPLSSPAPVPPLSALPSPHSASLGPRQRRLCPNLVHST